MSKNQIEKLKYCFSAKFFSMVITINYIYIFNNFHKKKKTEVIIMVRNVCSNVEELGQSCDNIGAN